MSRKSQSRFQGRGRITTGVVVVFVVVALALWFGGGKTSTAQITTTVQQGQFVVTTTTVGELAAVNSKPIMAPPGWGNRVTHLIDEGTLVKVGDVLANFDTDQLEQRVEEQQASYEGALAELENQRVTNAKTLANKEALLEQAKLTLLKDQLQTEAMQFESQVKQRLQALNLRRTELNLQEAQENLVAEKEIGAVRLVEKEVKARKSQLDLERTQSDLAKLTVLAPDSGMVVYKKVWAQGDMHKVRVGDQLYRGTSFMELPDLSAFLVNTWVNEVDIHRLEVDQIAEVTIDALQDRVLPGKVIRISPLARQEGDSKLKVFDVDIQLSGDLEGLLPGMTAQCRITNQAFDDVKHVPLEAVFQEDDGPVVYRPGGKARSVKLGPVGADRVVIEDGVDIGEVLLLTRPDQDDEADL